MVTGGLRTVCVVGALLVAASTMPATPLLPGYLTDETAGQGRSEDSSYVTPEHLRYPYASTYYVEPTVQFGEPMRIRYFVTDWNHSKARLGDDSARFDVTVRYSLDGTNWLAKTAKNVRTGDGLLDLGTLPVGEWTLSLQATDLRNGLPSGIVWHDFRIVDEDFLKIPDVSVFHVTEEDLADYGITRLSADYERIVPVPVDWQRFSRRGKLQATAEDAHKRIDEFLSVHPHRDGKTPGYSVYVPAVNDVPVNRAYEMARIVRDAGYDTKAVALAASATREGLQRLLDEKRTAGFRKVILPKGVYRMDEKTVTIPPGLVLDLGGATMKLNGFTGCKSIMFGIGAGRDTVLENGIVEGDYFEHDYAGSEHKSGWVHGWMIHSGAWYCEVRDVVTRNITGYGGGNKNGMDPPGKWLTYSSSERNWNIVRLEGKDGWTSGGYGPDGRYDEQDTARWTSRRIDVSGFIPFKYLTVAKLSGYRGMRTRNWNLTVSYFDVTNAFLKAELVSQFRVSLLPPKAKYARVSIEVASLSEAQKCDLTVYLLKIPQNGAIRRCRFERCRAVGYAMADCRNWLMEDCDFSYCGETLATCAFDAEDGWDNMQDATFRRNRFHDNPNNDFLTCGGHNFVYEQNVGKVHLWPYCYSPCIRSNDCKTATFCCKTRNSTGYGRYEGNRYEVSLKIGGDKVFYRDWNIVFDGYEFRSRSTNTPFQVQSGGTGLFRNCLFDGVSASPGAAEKCSFRNCSWDWARYNCGTIIDCIFENCRIPRMNATNLYDHCSFRNVTLAPARWSGQYFRNCILDGVVLPKDFEPGIFTGLVTRCTLKGACVLPRAMINSADNRDERSAAVAEQRKNKESFHTKKTTRKGQK